MEEEQNVAPSAEASAPEPMSFDSALAHLNAQDEAPEQTEPAATETAEAVETVEEADQAEAPTTETDADPDADPEPELDLHGNAKTRLRDGREVTISELKKRWDEAEEYKAKLPEIETRTRELEQKQQAIAAQEQLFTRSIQQAQDILRANFPQKPDYAAVQRGEMDIITFNEKQAEWQHAAEKWQRLEHAKRAHAQEAEQKQAEARKSWLQQQKAILVDKVPEFASEEAFKAFTEEGNKIAKEHYGFADEDFTFFDRASLLLMAKDAIAYRKLQADKAKVAAKIKDVPPVAKVQAPGRRIEPAERQAQVVKSGFDRLRKTGSFDDALAILNEME